MLISSGDTEYITDPYGNVVSAYSGDDYYVYSSDIQGSTACITDGDNISAEYEYSDFGEAAATADESFFNEICYTGAVYDNATGMYYMRARYYEPGTGRFITQDTYRGEVSDSNTWHLYAYCSNDPVNYTDPSGHKRRYLGIGCQVCLSKGVAIMTFVAGVDLIWYKKGAVGRYNSSQAFHAYLALGASASKEREQFLSRLKDTPKNISSKSKAKKLISGMKNVAISVGAFAIFGNDKFQSYRDYRGISSSISFSVRHIYGTISCGSCSMNFGGGFTTAAGMTATFGGGISYFNKEIWTSIKAEATSLKKKVEGWL